MSRPNSPTCTTLNWAPYNKVLKRRESLTIWFDIEMTWDVKLAGFAGC